MAVGFFVTLDRDRMSQFSGDKNRSGGFTSDLLQDKLLHYLRIGNQEIDPYDGGIYEGEALPTLVQNLNAAIADIQKKPSVWPLTSERLNTYYEDGRMYKIDLLPPRDQSIAIMRRLIELAKLAHASNEQLIFIGD